MKHLGDFDTSTVVYGKFTTYRPTTGATFALGGTPVLSVYKDNSITQSTTGVTLTTDFDSVTGLNHYAVDTSLDGTFYSAGSFFDIVITTGTVDSVSVTGTVVGSFTIRKNSALKPTTAARTLDVSATGEAGLDWANIGSPTTAVNLSATNIDVDQIVASVSGAVGSVTGLTAANLDVAASTRMASYTQPTGFLAATFPGTVASTTNITAGTITTATNVTTVNGLAAGVITAASIAADAITDAKVAADVTIASVTGAVGSVTGAVGSVTGAVGSVTGNVGGNVTGSVGSVVGAVGSVTAMVTANTIQISGDSIAADNAEAFFDGTGYAGTNNVIPTVTTLTGHTPQTGDSFARIGATGSGLTSLATQASVNTIDDFLDTEIAAIKAKTDNLPAAPAAVGDIPTALQNADALLNRDMSLVSDTNARTPLMALRFLRNKWSISGTSLTVTKEDDVTSAWTAVVTAAPGADPISGNDPT